VDAFFTLALAKEPEARFQDARSMREALAQAFRSAEAAAGGLVHGARAAHDDELVDTLLDP
jgi:hypothetical protein